MENIKIQNQPHETRTIRNFNKDSIHDFKTKLSYKIWDNIFGENDVDSILNKFHNTHLRIFYSSFPKKKLQVFKKDTMWFTTGIKISINHKRELYLKSRNGNNPKLKVYYKLYSTNNELYHNHISLANIWGNMWEYTRIHDTIEADLHEIMNNKYQTLNNKISKLTQVQITKPKAQQTFYPRVINNTSITFTTDELNLLNKGPKYNLHHKQRNWITKLGLEAENAISLQPTEDRNYHRKQVAQKIIHLHQQKNDNNNQNKKGNNTH
jgi:hypothetical protein